MYGRIYIPTGRLDAVYSTRLSPTLQTIVAAISDPRQSLYPNERDRSGVSSSNIMFSLQHDTGRHCTEYSYSAEDGMWGLRCLYNFGKIGSAQGETQTMDASSKPKRVDEEDAMEGGLKGRISAGAEFYISRQEKSAGGECTTLRSSGTDCIIASSYRRRSVHHPPRCNASFVPALRSGRLHRPGAHRQTSTISATHNDNSAL